MSQKNNLWIDTRLTEEEMVFLNKAIISEEENNNRTSFFEDDTNNKDWKENTAGTVSRCDLIDKDNWFYETALKKPTEKMFYDDWDNYRKYVVNQEESCLPKFELFGLWVNYQKKHDHVPIHDHSGLFSFVVFMKIPTHWKEQHVRPKKLNSPVNTPPSASNFTFVLAQSKGVEQINFQLSPEDEGRMLFFPAWMCHQVYPFYECEEERITISGNIILEDPKKPEMSVDDYEQKEQTLELLENSVKITKEELMWMKKHREKENY